MVFIIILSLICICLLGYIFTLKRIMRNIGRELQRNREVSYNKQVDIPLIDSALIDMTVEINKNLDHQKQLKLRSERNEERMKKSVSDIAHDLRTPLTVMIGNLQILEREPSMTGEDRQRAAVCLKKARELRSMADDFFDLSVLESETEQRELSRVDMTAAIIEFLTENEAVITANDLTPEVSLPEKSIFVYADPSMLNRMFSNLLNNIIKYARDFFFVSMEVTEDKKCCVTFANEVDESRVFDTEHLFDRSYRGDMARSGGGAGLGLYIVKLLAEKQHGRVEAVRENRLLSVKMVFNII